MRLQNKTPIVDVMEERSAKAQLYRRPAAQGLQRPSVVILDMEMRGELIREAGTRMCMGDSLLEVA